MIYTCMGNLMHYNLLSTNRLSDTHFFTSDQLNLTLARVQSICSFSCGLYQTVRRPGLGGWVCEVAYHLRLSGHSFAEITNTYT